MLEISPMICRPLLVPTSCTLRESHGLIQVVTSWEGIRLYQFHPQAKRYGSLELSAVSPDGNPPAPENMPYRPLPEGKGRILQDRRLGLADRYRGAGAVSQNWGSPM
jgi:Plasmid pRiA4b ORF-3-like protein